MKVCLNKLESSNKKTPKNQSSLQVVLSTESSRVLLSTQRNGLVQALALHVHVH